MYNAEHIANKIKQCAKEKNITLRTMLSDLHMGINTVSKISSGTEISYIDFARIADYLGVSVDFLLNREITHGFSPDEEQLIDCFAMLSKPDKTAVLNHAQSLARLAQLEESQAVQKEEVS